MVECFHQISDDSECRAVVLTGAGKLFTAGWNIADFNVTNMLISPCILYKISSFQYHTFWMDVIFVVILL